MFVLLVIFCVSLRHHLRGDFQAKDYEKYMKSADINSLLSKNHTPLLILRKLEKTMMQSIQSKYNAENSNENLGNMLMIEFSRIISTLGSALGACERIVASPAPYFYSINTSRFLSLYLFSLPLAMIPFLHWYDLPLMNYLLS